MGDEGDKGAGDLRLDILQQYTLKTTKQVRERELGHQCYDKVSNGQS